MAELQGEPGELRFTVQVKRAATGKVETFDMIGKVKDDGCDSQHSGPKRRN